MVKRPSCRPLARTDAVDRDEGRRRSSLSCSLLNHVRKLRWRVPPPPSPPSRGVKSRARARLEAFAHIAIGAVRGGRGDNRPPKWGDRRRQRSGRPLRPRCCKAHARACRFSPTASTSTSPHRPARRWSIRRLARSHHCTTPSSSGPARPADRSQTSSPTWRSAASCDARWSRTSNIARCPISRHLGAWPNPLACGSAGGRRASAGRRGSA